MKQNKKKSNSVDPHKCMVSEKAEQTKSKNAQIACFLEMLLLNMLTSQNFAGLSRLMSEIKPEIFRSIFKRLAILQNNL